MNIRLASCYMLCCLVSLQAQTITGSVMDRDTKQPIPFANIYFNNTSHGTSADGDGYFTLSVW